MLVTIRPDIIIKAKQAGLPVRAFWLWNYAKHICKAGGTIPEQALKDSLKAIGISKSSRCDWLNSAVKIGLFTLVVSNRTGLIYYELASWAKGAIIAGFTYKDRLSAPVTVEFEKFISSSWVAELWAGYLLQLRGRDQTLIKITRDKRRPDGGAIAKVIERKAKPISRKTLTELTGVSRRAQQYREKKAEVQQVENYLIGRSGVGYQPYGHDKENPGHHAHGGVELLRLPNSKAIPQHLQGSYNKSRTRKINKAIKALCKSDAIAERDCYPRLYADSFDHALALRCAGVMYPTRELAPGVQAWQRMKQYES